MSDDRHDRVRRRAYELWEQQGGEHGSHEAHWHRAAAEIDGSMDGSDDGGRRTVQDEAPVAAPDGTTLTVAGQDEPKPARRRAAAKPSASADTAAPKASAKPRKPKAK